MPKQASGTFASDAPAIRTALREGTAVSDDRFDLLYPATLRYRSAEHWTPVDVARLASRWLGPAPGGHVLDIGAGVGKVCHVGALSSDLIWSGVERVASMVRIAARVARHLGIESRTRFIRAEALELDWSRFGGVYLFNPFIDTPAAQMPVDPAVRQAAFIHEILDVERKLRSLYPGARVVTYHGFGGDMPPVFEMVERVQVDAGFLCLWIRTATTTT